MRKMRLSESNNIIRSFKKLKGNTRVSVMCEPMWGIPYVLMNFYLSLYMKGIGITDRQIGYLISLGFTVGTVFSLFGGVITDRLGRKKTTAIFDFISWPGAVLIYLVSNDFWMFALATAVNNVGRVVSTSWNLMVVEDADTEQRVSAFNLLGIINLSSGIIIPLGGLLVQALGVVHSERVLLAFALVSMTIMIITRNHFYTETGVGRQILEEHRMNPVRNSLKTVLPYKAAAVFIKKPAAVTVICVFILFSVYIPLGTMNSLYFAPYMTETLKLGDSVISVLGGVYSAVMLLIFVFVIPLISKINSLYPMVTGLAVQGVSLFLLTVIPAGRLDMAVLCIILYAVGFGVCRPFIDTLLAGVTEGNDRAGIYAIVNAITCVATALVGLVSGAAYIFNPKLIYIASIVLLALCIVLLFVYTRYKEYRDSL